jgi:hypothetical protein
MGTIIFAIFKPFDCAFTQKNKQYDVHFAVVILTPLNCFSTMDLDTD